MKKLNKKSQKIFVIVAGILIIFAFFYAPTSDSLLGSFVDQFTEPNWQEVREREIVKNSIPIILLEEQGARCKVLAHNFDLIIDHQYFIRANELASQLNYDRENETLMLPCDLLMVEKSRLNVWYVIEESPTHSKKYQYFVTIWNETSTGLDT